MIFVNRNLILCLSVDFVCVFRRIGTINAENFLVEHVTQTKTL